MCKKCNYERSIETANEILEKIEELPERAEDFASSVEEKTKGILESIELRKHTTDNINTALDNMLAGVNRWLDH